MMLSKFAKGQKGMDYGRNRLLNLTVNQYFKAINLTIPCVHIFFWNFGF